MSDANNMDLTQFERWYSQAGTPIVEITHNSYDAIKKTYTLTFKQHTPSTPGQNSEDKLPFMIPIVTGLLSTTTGKEIYPSKVLILTQSEQSFVFENILEKPIASILRDFSAPIKLKYDQSDEELAFIMVR